MFKKLLLILLLLFSTFIVIACNKNGNDDKKPDEKEDVKEITEVKASQKSKLEYEDTNINGLILDITYNNGETLEVNVTSSLIKTDLSTLTDGNNTIKVEYEGFTVEFIVTITPSIEKLLEEYYLVILIEASEARSKVSFYTEYEVFSLNFGLKGATSLAEVTKYSENILKDSAENVDFSNIYYVNTENTSHFEEILTINGTKLTQDSIEIKEFCVLNEDKLVNIPKGLIKIIVK